MQPINPNIKQAKTIDKEFYLSSTLFEEMKEKIFAKSWQFVAQERELNLEANSHHPFHFMEHYIDEPLLLVKDKNAQLSCLSNVCTHRGFLLADKPAKAQRIVCKYHGRSFNLDGTVHHMPEFKDVENFPAECDHLQKVPLSSWKDFLFSSLNPAFEWEEVTKVLDSKVGFLPLDQFRYAPQYTKEYMVKSNWAVYCDNYLEGFHIPFVHHDLNAMIDYGQYTTECYDYCNVQIGYADEGSDYFNLPIGHPEHGKKVTAYYFWLFPNMMMNFYKYGLQINVVKPISVDRCKVSFLFFLHDEAAFKAMDAEAFSAKVEREDEFVVEAVQKGLQSRFYRNGRLSPNREQGVHHFHQLAYKFLNA